MKNCVDCAHYRRRRAVGGGYWNDCKAPEVIKISEGPIRKTTEYGECYQQRFAGIFGFFVGKCGPEAVLFKQQKKLVPPGPE